MAVAALNDDMDAFLAAQEQYSAMKARFPASWNSKGLYDPMLEITGYADEDELMAAWTPDFDNIEEWARKAMERRARNVSSGLQKWLENTDEQEVLDFHRLVLRALEFRHENTRWPEPGEVEGWFDDGSARQGVYQIEPTTVFARAPEDQRFESIFAAYQEAEQHHSALTLEKLLPFVPDELIPLVEARFFEAESRSIFYRSSPQIQIKTFGVGADLLFVPIRYSEDFRRFMRGEDISP